MTHEPIGLSGRYLRTLFDAGVTSGFTDGQLLERFATQRDEAADPAFTALVERHGPMVLRACRGILRDDHEAMDAELWHVVASRSFAILRPPSPAVTEGFTERGTQLIISKLNRSKGENSGHFWDVVHSLHPVIANRGIRGSASGAMPEPFRFSAASLWPVRVVLTAAVRSKAAGPYPVPPRDRKHTGR